MSINHILHQLRTSPGRSARIVQFFMLLAGLMLWLPIGALIIRPPWVYTIDVKVFYQAGRVFLSGGDPYGPDFAAWMTGDATRASYAYPPASFGVLLPILPLPRAYAIVLWFTASLGCLLLLTPLLDGTLPRRLWFLPLAYYPSMYTLNSPQWAPILLGLLGVSIYLFRRGFPFWAGLLVPFMLVKPTVGLGLGVFVLLWCGRERRWWLGCVVGGLIGYGLPFIMQPDWPMRWLDSVRRYADPADQQYLVTLTQLWDGQVCAVIALALAGWSVYTRRWRTLSCVLLILSMLITPHRSQYDYAVLCVPFVLLRPRWRNAAIVGVAASWLFPATNVAFNWASSLQLTLFTFLPALLACVGIDESLAQNGEEFAKRSWVRTPTSAMRQRATPDA